MSKVKISELAKELGVTWKQLAEEIKNITGETIKSASKTLDPEVVELIKETYGITEEEPVEESPQKEGIKIFDLTQKLNVSFEDISEALRMIDFQGEISNLTTLSEETVEKLKEALKELERKRKEEEKQRIEREKRRREKRKLIEKKILEKKKEERTEVSQQEIEVKEEKTEEKVEVPEIKKQEEEVLQKPVEEKTKETIKEEKEEVQKEEKILETQEEIEVQQRKIETKEKKPQELEEISEIEEEEESKEEVKEPEKTTKELKKEKEELEALRKLMKGTTKSKRKKPKKPVKKEEEKPEKKEEIKIVEIPELITVRELADLLDLPVNTIMADLLKKGVLTTVNQTIDPNLAVEVAEEHGFLAELKSEEEVIEKKIEPEVLTEEELQNLVERPPVVTVMGHVDHGKTTLLDTIRKTDVAAKEKGGITQHIGAYKIKLKNGKEITFLDTPGHEAFTTLRARGSKVADIAVLVVAADDGVQPQTVEAINHAKSAELPIIVAINKIDKPGADPERIKRELTQYNLIPEEWGGDTIMVPVSAKTGENLEELLENILLVAEILELKANPDKPAVGTIIESKLDPKRGPVATVLVQNGTLKQGDYFVAGMTWGKVRAMFDERGKQVKAAPPSTPVEVLGFQDVPQAGDRFVVMPTEREAKQLAEQRKLKYEEEMLAKKARLKLESLEGAKEVNIILKADVQGSLEAIIKTLEDLSKKFEDVSINIVHSGVGRITEGDVVLAAASNAIIIGFNVRPDSGARKLAEEEGVDIKTYGIIYDIIDDLEKALKGMLEPKVKEQFLGSCEVKAIFRVKGVGTVAGCYVTEGIIRRNAKAKLVRDGIVIYDGEVISLKRFKDDVKEVAKGFECGLMLKDFNDIKPGDVIEAYELVEEKIE